MDETTITMTVTEDGYIWVTSDSSFIGTETKIDPDLPDEENFVNALREFF